VEFRLVEVRDPAILMLGCALVLVLLLLLLGVILREAAMTVDSLMTVQKEEHRDE
jgi:hypothetical protein